jgi:hypothetical protein
LNRNMVPSFREAFSEERDSSRTVRLSQRLAHSKLRPAKTQTKSNNR